LLYCRLFSGLQNETFEDNKSRPKGFGVVKPALSEYNSQN